MNQFEFVKPNQHKHKIAKIDGDRSDTNIARQESRL